MGLDRMRDTRGQHARLSRAGTGDDEDAGDKIKEAMVEGSPEEEAGESPDVEISEQAADGGDDENFADYKKREMKRGNKSPIKDRKVAFMMVKGPQKSVGGGKGRF